jgi:uncharacterized protein YeeX (DUF496 family)
MFNGVGDDIRQLLGMDNRERDFPVADQYVVVSEPEEVDELKRSQSPSFFEDNEGQSGLAPEGSPPLIKQDDLPMDEDKDVELNQEVSKIKESVDQVINDVQILRYSKRKAAGHIHKAEKKLEDLDRRITYLDSLCSSHSACISDMREAETSRITSIVTKRDDEEKKDAALNALLGEMRVFREQTSKQIAEEVEALKATREEALSTIKDLTAQVQTQALQTTPTLKRKRSESDNDSESDLPPRRTKRTGRRIVSTVLQTAGVFTVGAVATWSALAFS